MAAAGNNNNYKILVVDLDGTLIRSDIFLESILVFLKQKPLNFIRLLVWLIAGRSVAKTLVARQVRLDVSLLPYESELLDYIRLKKQQGCRIILATACHWFYANKVARHLGLFDEVIATRAKDNLKGARKLARIRERVGDAPFAYAGDSVADRPIWRAAVAAVHVNSRMADIVLSESGGKLEKSIQSRPSAFKTFIRAMRVHQYTKNALIVVPLVTSHSYGDAGAVVAVFWAVVCFSLCASGVYFLNDLLDLAADRQHATKRNRPLAAGELSLATGVIGAVALPLVAFTIAIALLPLAYVAVLALYYLLTNAYSFYLKRISTVDVVALAVLYTLRIIAGAVVIDIVPSSWLLEFSVFVFLSLAYLKRYIEVSAMIDRQGKVNGRGYAYDDRETLFVLGASNSAISVLVLLLYINSPAVSVYYPNPQVLWLLGLLMLYWSNRLWVKARRGEIHEDPVVFAIKDFVSRAVLAGFIVIAMIARFM